jgi:hypothetical protein
MDREYSVRVGETETLVSVRQTGAESWLAKATLIDGDLVEFSSDDPDYAVERVKQVLQETDETRLNLG